MFYEAVKRINNLQSRKMEFYYIESGHIDVKNELYDQCYPEKKLFAIIDLGSKHG